MSPTNGPFMDERVKTLNRLACKVLLHTKEMVDYVEGSDVAEGHNLEFLESVTKATSMALSKLSKGRECDGQDDGLWGVIRERVIEMAREGESVQSGNQGKRASEENGGKSKKKRKNDKGKADKLTARWESIGRLVYGEAKHTLSDLLAVVNNTIVASYGTHREEEDAAIARLSRGYSRFSLEEITRKLQTSTQRSADWRQQIEWDKDIDGAAGTGNRIEEREKYLIRVNNALAPTHMINTILDTMVQIKLAADWAKKDASWIKQYNNRMFELRCAEEVKSAKGLLGEGQFRKWMAAARRKYVERVSKENSARVWTMKLYLEYGSIVLLDPLWNPTAFGRGNRTHDFGSYMNHHLQTPILKRATVDDISRYPGKLVDKEGSKWIPFHYGNNKDNDYVLLELVRFMTGDDMIVMHIEKFLAGDLMTTE
ncbi:hypothetical protein PLEOSDRAFT_1108630 [Pleurotus ostreatus PC15]|uniref:Uncharacterized protein n=1 Tax=Pleurotus ostreatus (strain PC15) TaxID=1137138 RepID=A0A067NJ82_PLEO1|nr:hypothetical protein PLEOSDRAFT_1108630 [Pleurotus ostreatus PC15]